MILDITEKIEIKDFPKTIQFVLSTKFEDGKKRALFLLLTFLYTIKWEASHIEQTITDWNNMQEKPLKKNYINAQYSWFRSAQKLISTPNFNNANYYSGIGVPKEIIDKDRLFFKRIQAKNPIHFIYLLLKSKSASGKSKK